MLVDRIVVHDEMQGTIRGNFPIQPLYELNPFLMAMSRVTGPKHFSGERIQVGEEGECSVPFVVWVIVPTVLQGDPGLGPFQGLNLALLVGTEHQCLVERIEVEPNHVRQLLDKLGIPAEFEGARSMRGAAMGLPNAVDRLRTVPHHRSQGPRCPVGGLPGGELVVVKVTMQRIVEGRIRGGRPARGTSRSRPAKRYAAKRIRQRPTHSRWGVAGQSLFPSGPRPPAAQFSRARPSAPGFNAPAPSVPRCFVR